MRRFIPLMFSFLFCAAACLARMPDLTVLTFSITTNVGWGSNVYVSGSAPELGGWDVTRALKLCWAENQVWSGRAAVRKGQAVEYKYIVRDGAPERFCDPSNAIWPAGANSLTGKNAKIKLPGKIIYYYSGWTSASLRVRSGTHDVLYQMSRASEGRVDGEWLYRASRVETVGGDIAFTLEGMKDGVLYEDKPPVGLGVLEYRTPLDNFVIQDGGIYNYWPAHVVAEPRIEGHHVESSVAGITGRAIRVYLPRGYDQHPSRHYPVIYFQDGTNVFSPGGSFGSWDADLAANREISMGRMRESIMVAVDNTPKRRSEYNPDGDTYPGEDSGMAGSYLNYLADDVIGFVARHYRTASGREHRVVAGSSMGGIFSIYAGFSTNLFGGVLAMSPSFTRAPEFTRAIPVLPKPAIRIYMDTGNEEGMIGPAPGGDYWDSVWLGYDQLLAAGFIPGRELLMRTGCGHGHNESAWRDRLPEALRFLLNPLIEPVMTERVSFSEEAPTH